MNQTKVYNNNNNGTNNKE